MAKNLIKEMKERIAKSGANKKEILYFGKDSQKRVRFLQELDAGHQFQFHNDWATSVFELCKDPEDHENCKLCEDGIAIQDNFVWSVWDYDSSSVRILQFKATGVSPVPALIEMYEEFGTIMDRDYKIKKVGQGQGASFVVTPLDKERFKNSKAKPYTYKEIKEILEKAWVSKDIDADDDDNDEADEDEVDTKSKKRSKKRDTNEDEEETTSSKKSKKSAKKAKKKPSKENIVRNGLEEMSFKELKVLCSEIGMTKKELKEFDEQEELVNELLDNYDLDDLKDLLDEYSEPDEEEEDEEDDDEED